MALTVLAILAAGCTKEVEVPGETVIVEKEVVKVVTVEVEKELTGGLAKEAERYGGNLRIAATGLEQLDPFAAGGYTDLQVAQHIWSPLFDRDLTQNTQPVMAESWSVSADGLTYTFVLRSGLTFQDGSPITTDDVMPSFQRWVGGRGPGGKVLKDFLVEDPLTKVGDLAFTMTMKEVFGSAMEAIGGGGITPPYIFPEEVARIDPATDMASIDENYYNLGSGPYKLKQWLRGDRITIERYDGYQPRNDPTSWRTGRQNQYLDEISFIDVPAEETRIAGLKTGIWEVVEGAGLDFFDTLNDHPDIDVRMRASSKSALFFNLNDAESIMTRDVKIRQALLAGLNMADFMGSLGPQELWSLCSAVYGKCKGAPWKWETRIADPLYDQRDIAKPESTEGMTLQQQNG